MTSDAPNYSRDSGRRARDERVERMERNEPIGRVGPTGGTTTEPRTNPPRVVQQRQPEPSGTPRTETRGETTRPPAAVGTPASVKNKEGREEKTGERSERQERGERTAKTAPQ
jgi:hypothetical protein